MMNGNCNGRSNRYVRWLRALPFIWIAITVERSTSSANGFSFTTLVAMQQQQQRDHRMFQSSRGTPFKLSATTTSSSSTSTSPVSIHDDLKRLKGVVCVVTGASRGIGKGIALELGKEGATVYVTGTSSSTSSRCKDENMEPGTVEETADEITKAGGVGIPIICNHADDAQVKALFQKIQQDHGRIDILVNNAFRIPKGGVEQLQLKFWQDTNAEMWDAQHTVGLRSHYVASCCAIPLMLQQSRQESATTSLPRSLIVMISSFGGISYSFNVAYGVAKAGVDRLAKDMAVELTAENISVVSLWPGVVLTERNRRSIASGEWQEHVKLPLEHLESPALTGKVVVELALDPNNVLKTGTYQVVAELANNYQIREADGIPTPPSIRSLRFLLPAYGLDEKMRNLIPSWLIPDWKLPFFLMALGRPDSKSS